MFQLCPKAISGVGYGDFPSLRVGVFDGRGSYTENVSRAPMPFDGTVRGFALYCGVAHPDITVDILIDRVTVGLTLTLGSGETSIEDVDAELAYVAGQSIEYRITTAEQLFPGFPMSMCVGNESEGQAFTVGAIFHGSMVVGYPWYAGALGNGYWAEGRSSYSINALEGSVTRLTLKRWVVQSGGSWLAQLEVDEVLQDGTGGTIDTSCELLDSDPDDTVSVDFDLPLTPGQRCNVIRTRVGTAGDFGFEQLGVGVGFVPDNPNAFMCCGGSNDLIPIPGPGFKWNHSVESGTTLVRAQAPIVRYPIRVLGLYVEHSFSPGTGETFTDTVLNNGVASDIAAVISDDANSGNDLGSQLYRPGDFIAIELASTAGADNRAKFYWGLAAEIVFTGTLIVEKIATDDPDQDFEIAAGGGLDPDTITLKDGESYTFEDVPEGSGYSLEETLPDGWVLADVIVSNDPSNNDITNIAIAEGETVTVTFTNQQNVGTIVVEKTAPDDPTRDFSMLASEPLSPEAFTLKDGESRTFEDVPVGDGYFISELVPPGWSVEAVVSNGSPLDNISVAIGELVTVSLVNTKTPCECCVATKIQIINDALLKLGHSQTIVALTDATREAYTGNLLFDNTLKELLRAYPWAFATKYADSDDNLAGYMDLVDGSLSDPAVGRSVDNATEWQYAYRYPLDCLFARRIVPPEGRKFDRNPIPFRKGRDDDGLLIYTNEPDAVLEYTALVECSENFADQLFEDALSWLLASKMAPSLSRNGKTAQDCWGMHKDVLNQAGAVDAKEQQQEPDGPAAWIEDRG